jgi:endonuclease/exonuclease/phosphatase (EEP) superfamily protein YafD
LDNFVATRNPGVGVIRKVPNEVQKLTRSIRTGVVTRCGLLLLILAGCAHDTTLNRADIHLYGGLAAGRMPAESDSLVCISYNIEYSEELEQALLDLTTDPRLQQPDILLLQEMDAEGAAFLAGRLGLNHFYYPSFIHPHHGRLFGNAVLSPWPLQKPRAVILPHPNPLTDNRRTALAVDVQVGSRTVRAVSVHLSTLVVDLEDRLEQAVVVGDSLVAVSGPTVIGGDFNTGTRWEETLVRRVFRRIGFREAHISARKTARGGPLDLVGYNLKLDHIYYRDLEPVAAGVSPGATAGDHFPIWSVFRWRD